MKCYGQIIKLTSSTATSAPPRSRSSSAPAWPAWESCCPGWCCWPCGQIWTWTWTGSALSPSTPPAPAGGSCSPSPPWSYGGWQSRWAGGDRRPLPNSSSPPTSCADTCGWSLWRAMRGRGRRRWVWSWCCWWAGVRSGLARGWSRGAFRSRWGRLTRGLTYWCTAGGWAAEGTCRVGFPQWTWG